MSKFCTQCGIELKQEIRFCTRCGYQLPKILREKQENTLSSVRETEKINPDEAGQEGVMTVPVVLTVNTEDILQPVSPALFLSGSLKGLFSNMRLLWKDRKKLLVVLLISLIWVLQIMTASMGINPLPFRMMSFLTLAMGGSTGGLFGFIGGTVGKGLFVYTLISLSSSRFSRENPVQMIRGSIQQMISLLKKSRYSESMYLLAGGGLGLIASNFLTGDANLQNGMAIGAAWILSLRALGSQQGFLRGLIQSVLFKIFSRNPGRRQVTLLMAGISTGLILSLPLFIFPGDRIGYMVGILLIVGALIMGLRVSRKKEVS